VRARTSLAAGLSIIASDFAVAAERDSRLKMRHIKEAGSRGNRAAVAS
jgi:hypothetical protein